MVDDQWSSGTIYITPHMDIPFPEIVHDVAKILRKGSRPSSILRLRNQIFLALPRQKGRFIWKHLGKSQGILRPIRLKSS